MLASVQHKIDIQPKHKIPNHRSRWKNPILECKSEIYENMYMYEYRVVNSSLKYIFWATLQKIELEIKRGVFRCDTSPLYSVGLPPVFSRSPEGGLLEYG